MLLLLRRRRRVGHDGLRRLLLLLLLLLLRWWWCVRRRRGRRLLLLHRGLLRRLHLPLPVVVVIEEVEEHVLVQAREVQHVFVPEERGRERLL